MTKTVPTAAAVPLVTARLRRTRLEETELAHATALPPVDATPVPLYPLLLRIQISSQTAPPRPQVAGELDDAPSPCRPTYKTVLMNRE